MHKTLKRFSVVNIIVYTIVCGSTAYFLAIFFGRMGFNVEPRQMFGLTIIGFNGLLALCIAMIAIGLFRLNPVAVRWTKRLAWIRLFTLAYSTTKTLTTLLGLFQLPDRGDVGAFLNQ